jgi:ABC-type uncharacterized transport system involved in gliding motility auxiliary subunit
MALRRFRSYRTEKGGLKMKITIANILFFVLLACVFLGATIVNNTYLQTVNIDLTSDKIYSLSKGSEKIAASVNEPISLYLFFSESTSVGMTTIRDYKARVESLLREYERLSKGKIRLEVIDPQPFSEAEDRAAEFGLTAASTGVGQDTIYFGLAATNSLDDAMVIGFFDPQKEALLEYDISSLIYQLDDPEPIKLTIVSDLQLAGGQNPLNGQITPPNVMYQQLDEIFDLSIISAAEETLPDNTQILLLWHPQNIDESLLFSIDQFLMAGGKALALLDPHYESDLMAASGAMGANNSTFELLATYGIDFDNTQVVLDALTGLDVRAQQQGGITRHLGFLGLRNAQINSKDITSADLDTVNGASFGTVSLGNTGTLSQTVLLSSSSNSALMPASEYSATQDPVLLSQQFSSQGKQLTLAARYSGAAPSHFANRSIPNQQDNDPKLTRTNKLNIVVVADADIAADRFWVQQSNFFGQTVSTPFADNSDFILNTLENLGGSEALIGIRSRGTFARPFVKVQEIQVLAEERFREQEKRLQAQLEQTEIELSELQTQGDSLILSPEQEAAIDAFTEKRVLIRKSLRDVQFQLQKDIDELGNILKLINIVAAPLILVIILFLSAKLFRKRAPKVTPFSMSDKKETN